jgi:hypothetical protein
MSTPSMLEEIIKSAKEQVADRLASPIIGSFVLSWCLLNYKFIVILFSAASVTKTFELIDTVAFPTAMSIFLKGVLFPAASALIYIFIYPYPAKFVYGFTRRRQKEILELRQSIEKETPLTIEDSRKIRAEIIDSDMKHKEDIDKLTSELNRTKDLLEVKVTVPTNTETPSQKPIDITLDLDQKALMRLIESKGGQSPHSVLIKQSNTSKTKTEFDLGELKKIELINSKYSLQHNETEYTFTHKGRGAVLALSQPNQL